MKITIRPTNARRYLVEAQGETTECHPSNILHERSFQIAFLEQNDRLWDTMGGDAFRDMVKKALDEATQEVTVSPERLITANLWDFVRFYETDDAQGIHNGQVLHRDGVALFKLASFEAFLRTRGHNTTSKQVSQLLVSIGCVKRGNTELGGQQVRPFAIPLDWIGRLYHGE